NIFIILFLTRLSSVISGQIVIYLIGITPSQTTPN
ncbi:unnamed protein product, partial [marine sediment metagenome]